MSIEPDIELTVDEDIVLWHSILTSSMRHPN